MEAGHGQDAAQLQRIVQAGSRPVIDGARGLVGSGGARSATAGQAAADVGGDGDD